MMAAKSDYERGVHDFNTLQTSEKGEALDTMVLGCFSSIDWTHDPSKEWKRGFFRAADQWQKENDG
jgi:hypothetical protein